MFCKNCGRNIGETQKELCDECEATLNTNVISNDNVEVIKEVGSNSNDNNNVVNNTTAYSDNNNNGNNNNYQTMNNSTNVNTSTNQKSKIAAGILGILLGSFGAHNFYLGYTGKAVAQLLLTLLSCGILAIVSEIWGLIEGILILSGEISTDANGIPLKE